MSNKCLRFGILGCGMIAHFHADAILHTENACLCGVADANTVSAAAFAEIYGVKPYDTFDDMLASDIDVVCICTPSGLHAENAITALQAGKHVVLEKPMALCVSDAERIKKAADTGGRLVTVISQLRFSQDIQHVKKLVEENAFGKLVLCDLYMKYWRDPAYYANGGWKGTKKMDGGGALMNQGIHGVDLLLYLVGDAAVRAATTKTAFHDIEVEDVALAMLAFDNGADGVIETSTCTYNGFERKIEILGTDGCAVFRENTLEKLIVQGKTLVDNVRENVAGTASDPAAMDSLGHTLQIRNLVNAVLTGEELLIDAKEGCRAVALIESIYKQNS